MVSEGPAREPRDCRRDAVVQTLLKRVSKRAAASVVVAVPGPTASLLDHAQQSMQEAHARERPAVVRRREAIVLEALRHGLFKELAVVARVTEPALVRKVRELVAAHAVGHLATARSVVHVGGVELRKVREQQLLHGFALLGVPLELLRAQVAPVVEERGLDLHLRLELARVDLLQQLRARVLPHLVLNGGRRQGGLFGACIAALVLLGLRCACWRDLAVCKCTCCQVALVG